MQKPPAKPFNPCFSSGPTAKRPGWDPQKIPLLSLGRSHRSALGKARLKKIIDLSRKILQIPDNYLLGIVPASDTGAMEMAIWNFLGPRGIDLFSWDAFGQDWAFDVTQELKLPARHFHAPYGELPDLYQRDPKHDILFTWNGTTSGVKVPNGEWIARDREGLTICDATSAIFAMDLPWEKLDIVTWSWQKALGGEAGHGMIALSPRAQRRLEAFSPPWPIPKIFRLKKHGKIIDGIFFGETINTPSLLAVEDQIDALAWALSQGGLQALIKRTEKNLQILEEWVAKHSWISFLASKKQNRSSTSICFTLDQMAAQAMISLLEKEGVAFDIGAYRDAPAGLRIWGGPTIEEQNLQLLLPWLEWAYHETRMPA